MILKGCARCVKFYLISNFTQEYHILVDKFSLHVPINIHGLLMSKAWKFIGKIDRDHKFLVPSSDQVTYENHQIKDLVANF